MKKKAAILALTCAAFVFVLAACAPQSAGTNGKNSKADSGSTTVAWSADADCTGCHKSQASATDSPAGIHQAMGQDCLTCHVEADMVSVHEQHGDSGREPSKLRYSEVNNEGCLASSCHVSTEALAEKTADITLTDSKGTSKNPHAVLSQVGHEDIECVSCHTMHKKEDIAEVSQSTCYGCHHAKVFECGTCHE